MNAISMNAVSTTATSTTAGRVKRPGRMLVAALLLAMGLGASVSAQTRIRLATMIPSGTSYHHSLQELGEKWKKASNGTIALTIYADGVMGSED